MYNPAAQILLRKCLKMLDKGNLDEPFRLRLISQFQSLYAHYYKIYHDQPTFEKHLVNLVKMLADYYQKRPSHLKDQDEKRENDPSWFCSEKIAGMMIYAERFNKDINGVSEKIPYLKELGINLLHLMPLFLSPESKNDGGYAVSDYKKVDPRFGTDKDLIRLTETLHNQNMFLMLDLVINHTSDQHIWAKKARAGKKKYMDYFYTFSDRTVPDLFEHSLPEVFPENSPGNFTWIPEMERYVMTVFNNYQWDLNYTNPEVFHEMTDILLSRANCGIDLFRLDAVAFLWKKLGTNSQNLPQAHILLQLFKTCAKIVAPGVIFLAEAIVAPKEIVKYFGESEGWSNECDVAYNATYMALLWDSLTTKETKILYHALSEIPAKPSGTTWINYVRCHDDIGLGYDNRHIEWAGFTPRMHRNFQVEFLTGKFKGSFSRGLPFMVDPKTGDSRISGTLASLAGLEQALENKSSWEIESAVKRILMMHGLMIAYEGIPMIYYGDELGTLNDYSFVKDPDHQDDNRWLHRPEFNWNKALLRNNKGTIEYRIFQGIRHQLAIRRSLKTFADKGDISLQQTGNGQLIAFSRGQGIEEKILILANVGTEDQYCPVSILHQNNLAPSLTTDYLENKKPDIYPKGILLAPYQMLWLG